MNLELSLLIYAFEEAIFEMRIGCTFRMSVKISTMMYYNRSLKYICSSYLQGMAGGKKRHLVHIILLTNCSFCGIVSKYVVSSIILYQYTLVMALSPRDVYDFKSVIFK